MKQPALCLLAVVLLAGGQAQPQAQGRPTQKRNILPVLLRRFNHKVAR